MGACCGEEEQSNCKMDTRSSGKKRQDGNNKGYRCGKGRDRKKDNKK